MIGESSSSTRHPLQEPPGRGCLADATVWDVLSSRLYARFVTVGPSFPRFSTSFPTTSRSRRYVWMYLPRGRYLLLHCLTTLDECHTLAFTNHRRDPYLISDGRYFTCPSNRHYSRSRLLPSLPPSLLFSSFHSRICVAFHHLIGPPALVSVAFLANCHLQGNVAILVIVATLALYVDPSPATSPATASACFLPCPTLPSHPTTTFVWAYPFWTVKSVGDAVARLGIAWPFIWTSPN